jgi:predicted phosphodiesterase
VRYLVLSDVHGNAEALETVLGDAERRGYDATLFLGDAVGYYPQVGRVVDVLRELEPVAALLGNHDAQLLAFADGTHGVEGMAAGDIVGPILIRQAEALSADQLDWIRRLQNRYEEERFEAVHGALARTWQYLHGLPEAEQNLPYLQRSLCLVGHTHVPRVLAATEAPGGRTLWRQLTFREEGGSYRMPPHARGFFNPGSVGQPRDGIPLASYALFDVDRMKLEVIRLPYDVVSVQRAVRAADYPEPLAARLAAGR